MKGNSMQDTIKDLPVTEDARNTRLWYRAIGRHLDAVNDGHISGEWGHHNGYGYKPLRVNELGEITSEPHHENR